MTIVTTKIAVVTKMDRENLKLIEPDFELRIEFLAMAAEYTAADEQAYAQMYAEAAQDFAGYVTKLRDHAKGHNLPQGWVRCSTYWLVRNEKEILGSSRLRHQLTKHLKFEGGHIGYDIRPSARQKGYGHAALALTLQKAREIGLQRVLLTCHADNIASTRIIEKNGGKFASIYIPDWPKKPLRRYWIKLL